MPDSLTISSLEGVAEAVGVEVGVAPEVAGLLGATVVAGVGAGAEVVAEAEADLTHKLCMLCIQHLGLQSAKHICMPWRETMAPSSVISCLGSTVCESLARASTPLLCCGVCKLTAYLEKSCNTHVFCAALCAIVKAQSCIVVGSCTQLPLD